MWRPAPGFYLTTTPRAGSMSAQRGPNLPITSRSSLVLRKRRCRLGIAMSKRLA